MTDIKKKANQPTNIVAERVKSARLQLGYSRKKFSEKFGISPNTLQAWENGKYELTQKGALRLVEALEQAGLVCNIEWFLDGEGLPPRPIQGSEYYKSIKLHENLEGQPSWTEDELILKEVAFFEENNPSPTVLLLSDDSMYPTHFCFRYSFIPE